MTPTARDAKLEDAIVEELKQYRVPEIGNRQLAKHIMLLFRTALSSMAAKGMGYKLYEVKPCAETRTTVVLNTSPTHPCDKCARLVDIIRYIKVASSVNVKSEYDNQMAMHKLCSIRERAEQALAEHEKGEG